MADVIAVGPAAEAEDDRASGIHGPAAPGVDEAPPATSGDPRAVRVAVAPASRLPEEEPIVIGPPPEALAPLPVSFAGRGVLGGIGSPDPSGGETLARQGYFVDGSATALRLERRGPSRAILHGPTEADPARRIVFAGPAVVGADGLTRREIVVDGWRIEVEIEPERRAALRERARRGREATAHGGPTEVHAIIPGRVVSVSVAPGDEVTAGQQILVVEAMKMQNELRAPRDGVVKQVGVAVGRTIEVGDLLLVIE